MREIAPYRNHLAEAFGMTEAPTLITRVLRKSTMAVTELKCNRVNFGMTAPIPVEDAYLIGLQFLPCLDHDLYFEGSYVRPTNWFAGAVTIYDLRRSPIADIRDPYHCLMFHLPRAALNLVADESDAPRIMDIQHRPGFGIDDPVIRHLLSSLLPAIARPQETRALFLDHVSLALTAHIAHLYGGMKRPAKSRRGGLAPRQERQVKELMAANLRQDVSLNRLARETGLSARHFARAFRQSTGDSPHRWMMKYRIEHAKGLMTDKNLSLAEIALLCGFADQSHFTRVFTAIVGASPGGWRKMAN